MNAHLTIPNPDAATELGHALGALLFPGAVVALVGTLGAGKTHLCRAVAEGLDIANAKVVTSPTFALIQEYDARLPIYHFDIYRLKDEAAFAQLGAEEYFFGDGVCLIEWADRIDSFLPRDHLRIEIKPTGESTREWKLTAFGERYVDLLAKLLRNRNSENRG